MDPITITPQTVTAVRLTVQLSEEQARAVLVDAAPFQRLLRDALQQHGSRNPLNERRSVKLGRPRKEPAAGKALGGKGGFAKEPCPDCRELISKAQMRQHRLKKHGVSAAALPASA